MHRLCLALLLSALTAAASASDAHVDGEPAWDGGAPSADASWSDPAYPLKRAAVTRFAPMAPERVDAVKRANASGRTKVLGIGLERATATEAEASGTDLHWQPAADGSHSARLEIESPEAQALRTGLTFHALPDSATLRFAGADGATEAAVPGVQANALFEAAAVYWSPATEGSRQSIEIHLPAGVDPRWTRVGVPRISHLFVSPRGDLGQAKIGESGSCNINASCVASASTPGYENAKNAVTRLLIQTPAGTGACTGTLLNDTVAATQVPLVFGAAHCINTASEAASVTTFWFYKSTGCNVIDLDPAARQVSGGATLLYADDGSDVSLVRMNNAPPGGAFYSGWSAAALASGSQVQVLHHPQGDVLKFSQGISRGTGPSSQASGSFHKVSYADGTTEGGSSGSGLLTYDGSQFTLRGGLLGGSASCANAGNVNNPGNSDDFSRLELEYANLQPFLAPSTSAPPSPIDYTGAWNNSSQSGWGLVVIRGSSGVYAMYIYHYDQDSTPGWYLSAGSLSGTSYNSGLLAFTGPWFGINPFNPAAVSNRSAGNLQVNFTSATSATINFTIDGRTVSTTLGKLAF
jgi:lysyl endopeptidase